LLTAWATLPLILIGGLVTSKGAGLAVPDWPTTFGYNMFLYPWSEMVGDIFYEHSHRLVASAVGLLTVALAVLLWLHERRTWLRGLGLAALGLVIVQGIIGGLRVILLEETLAILHGFLAQTFFALMVSLALLTSEEWKERAEIQLPDARRPFDRLRAVRELEPLRRLCLVTTAMIYIQGFFGAVVRFTGARLDAHLILAALVTLHVGLLAGRILGLHRNQPKLARPAIFLGCLLLLQLLLGLGSYLSKFSSLGAAFPQPAVELFRTAHVMSGALMLATSLVLTLRSYRWSGLPEPLKARDLVSNRVSA